MRRLGRRSGCSPSWSGASMLTASPQMLVPNAQQRRLVPPQLPAAPEGARGSSRGASHGLAPRGWFAAVGAPYAATALSFLCWHLSEGPCQGAQHNTPEGHVDGIHCTLLTARNATQPTVGSPRAQRQHLARRPSFLFGGAKCSWFGNAPRAARPRHPSGCAPPAAAEAPGGLEYACVKNLQWSELGIAAGQCRVGRRRARRGMGAAALV